MAISLTHSKVSAIADDPAASAAGEILPSDWNAVHALTQATGKLLGRTTAGSGAVEEISPTSPLVMAAGALSITGAALTKVDDTNVTLTLGGSAASALLAAASITVGWSGTLGAVRLNGNVVQSVVNDTNVTGSIATQALTLGWTGTLAAARLNSNVVQGITNDTNVTGSISAQVLTLGWTGNLAVGRGGTGAGTLTAHAVLLGEGTSTLGFATIGTAGRLLIDQGAAADPAFAAMSNDATISSAGALTVANSAITNAKQANMAAWTIKCNNSNSAAAPGDVTIDGLTAKASPVGADEIPIWDVAGAAMKKCTLTAAVGTGAVTSFNTRTGAVTAATGDYDVTQIYKEKFFQGRLTLTSATPVLTANTTAQGTVYYALYNGDLISIYDGTRFITYQFTEQSVVLDATNFLSGKNYDFFIFNSSGTPTLGYGPAWTNDTTRAGAIARVQGVWTNNALMTIRTSSSTTSSISANQATYVGTARGTANAQTGMNFRPTAATGGAGPVLGLYNAYNKVPISSRSNDSTASWTYNSSTFRQANNNAGNQITFIDGLGDVAVLAHYTCWLESSATGGSEPIIGMAFNGSTPDVTSELVTTSSDQVPTVTDNFLPALGYNKVAAMERVRTNTQVGTFGGVVTLQVQGLVIRVAM